MVTKKPVTAQPEAATFDVEAWLEDLQHQGLKPRNVVVQLHVRADLLPKIQSLLSEIQKLEEGPEREVGVDEADPLTELVAEYNALVDEFQNGGVVPFEFRPRTSKIQKETYAAWQAKYGANSADHREELILIRMAAACVSHPGITAEAFRAFENLYGTPALETLVGGFVEAYEGGGEPTAPFLPRPSPTPDTDG
jgi:hypothetical protein